MSKLIEATTPQPVITAFIDYAKAQGSDGVNHYRTSIPDCILDAVDDDNAGDHKLHLRATAKFIAEKVLIKGMDEQLPHRVVFNWLEQAMDEYAEVTS